MSYLKNITKHFELAGEGEDELYYLQPDGTYSCSGDGRTKGLKKSELPEGAEIAYQRIVGEGGPSDRGLMIKAVEPQTKMTLERIQKWAKTQGLTYKRSLQSAAFEMAWYIGPYTRFTRPAFVIDGWHGTGKGNRNYGDSAFVFSVYGQNPSKQVFDVYKVGLLGGDDASGGAFFVSQSEKNLYLANLKKIADSITTGKIDTLWM